MSKRQLLARVRGSGGKVEATQDPRRKSVRECVRAKTAHPPHLQLHHIRYVTLLALAPDILQPNARRTGRAPGFSHAD
jgi:hypothetical protein